MDEAGAVRGETLAFLRLLLPRPGGKPSVRACLIRGEGQIRSTPAVHQRIWRSWLWLVGARGAAGPSVEDSTGLDRRRAAMMEKCHLSACEETCSGAAE